MTDTQKKIKGMNSEYNHGVCVIGTKAEEDCIC